MLHQILLAHGGSLPDDVHVTFANTGKEREETLRFVHECQTRWAVRMRWLEYRDDGFEEVDFNSASRKGEPFEALIRKKKMPPNWQARFCTAFLKVQPMHDFMGSLGYRTFKEVIGLRYDEGLRVLKMFERNERDGRQCVAPLAKAKVIERDVRRFWREQPFDLGLEAGEGNCDLCFLKGRGLRKELIRRRPDLVWWWVTQERETGGWFDRRDSYRDLLNEVVAAPRFEFDLSVEHDAECGLLCPAE